MKALRKRRKLLSKEDLRQWAYVTRSVAPLPHQASLQIDENEAVDSSTEVDDTLPEHSLPRVVLRLKPQAQSVSKPQSRLVHGSTDGIDKRTADRFKKGNMTLDARIDLHGMTQDHAHDALLHFMRQSIKAKFRVVLVITGKGRQSGGQGILKGEVPRWLNEPTLRPHILSFSYAQPKHGGDGALYVYLKRDRSS